MATVTQPKKLTDPLAKMWRYVDGVMAGEVVVGALVRLAVERHVRDLETQGERNIWFDDEEARMSLEFIETLRHSKGEWAGKQLILEDWQVFVVASLFGWMRFDAKYRHGRRRFNTAFIGVGRKNGKSTLAAAIGHKLFAFDGEEGAEVYSAATKRDQAKIVHEEAKRMVKSSPALRRMVTVLRDNLSIEATNSKYEPLGANADSTDGLNISGVIVDEVHAHKTRELWDVLETATGARRNPLMVAITTAGEAGDTESIYLELKGHGIKVLEGTVEDDSWFVFIASPPDDCEFDDRDAWRMANPNLGVSVSIEDLERKVVKATATPAAVNNFRRRHLNQDVESLTPWVTIKQWNACAGDEKWYTADGLRPEVIARYRDRPCVVGGDLSSVNDLTNLTFAFPNEAGGADVFPFSWCPQKNAEGRQRDKRVPYLTWAQRGQLFLTEGDSVDYDALRELLRRARDEWRWVIREIHFDPNNARYLATKLVEEDGFGGDTVVEHQQTCGHMNDPIVNTEKCILDRTLCHGGHEVLRWCVSNVKLYTDTGGRRRFDKKNSSEKIDLAVAMVMGVGTALTLLKPKVSFYETHEARSI